MTQRLLLVLMLSGVVCAQHRSVDPKNLYHRIICVTPVTGTGTPTDPVRPNMPLGLCPPRRCKLRRPAPRCKPRAGSSHSRLC